MEEDPSQLESWKKKPKDTQKIATGFGLLYDDLLKKALMAYEVANFREWNELEAIWRYRNHPTTNRAVKTIAQIFSRES